VHDDPPQRRALVQRTDTRLRPRPSVRRHCLPPTAYRLASVTIAPRVSLYVSVHRLGARGNSGTFGGGGFGGFGGSRIGVPGSGGSRGFGGARRTLTGAITALSGQTLTLRATDGTTHTLAFTASTTVYRVVAVTSTQLQAGSFVTVSAATVAGRRVATDVVGTTTTGTMASIVSSAGATTGPTF
jgi:hypothetical protein